MLTDCLTDRIAVQQEHEGYVSVSRDECIKAIRRALKARSGKAWSVTGGRGTGYGWITITSPKARRTGRMVVSGQDAYGNDEYELVDAGEAQPFGYLTPQDAAELGALLNLERVHQGVSVASDNRWYVEFIARAEGRCPSTYGTQYWD